MKKGRGYAVLVLLALLSVAFAASIAAAQGEVPALSAAELKKVRQSVEINESELVHALAIDLASNNGVQLADFIAGVIPEAVSCDLGTDYPDPDPSMHDVEFGDGDHMYAVALLVWCDSDANKLRSSWEPFGFPGIMAVGQYEGGVWHEVYASGHVMWDTDIAYTYRVEKKAMNTVQVTTGLNHPYYFYQEGLTVDPNVLWIYVGARHWDRVMAHNEDAGNGNGHVYALCMFCKMEPVPPDQNYGCEVNVFSEDGTAFIGTLDMHDFSPNQPQTVVTTAEWPYGEGRFILGGAGSRCTREQDGVAEDIFLIGPYYLTWGQPYKTYVPLVLD